MTAPRDLLNWRQGVVPHLDIQENRVSESLFAVNLSRAIARQGAQEYRDPVLFFERTHLTRTLQSLIVDVLDTVQGRPGANSVIHLQTNFGGGKTHAELALFHLLKSPEESASVPHIRDFLSKNNFEYVPEAAVSVLPGADLYAGGREVEEGFVINTIWGELAYRLGNEANRVELYEIVRDSDQRRFAPGIPTLRTLLERAGPNLILIDELLHYVDKAAAVEVGDSNLGSQTLGFLRELTDAVDSVPHSVLVASVTASRMEDLEVLSRDDAQLTLAKLEDILRRLEDSRTPIEGTEIYDIIRTRLFQTVDFDVADQVAEAYFQFYKSDPWRDVLPQASRDAGYGDLLYKSYPFHPSIVAVLYERWGSRPQFQLTRGTLRFLSHLLAHLWKTESRDQAIGPLIHLSDIDLSDDDVRAETVRVAGSEWESVIGTDVAATESGNLSIAQRVDSDRGGLYAQYGLAQGISTSVFMFTHGGQQSKATARADARLAVARPTVPLSDLDQAFEDCSTKLYYFYEEDGGYIFKTEPNPNKVLADERANVQTDDARRLVETVVDEVVGKSNLFQVTLFGFQNSPAREPGDIPDDGELQLVVLPPRLTHNKGRVDGRAADVIHDITENYGKKLRLNRNMVLYLVPDSEYVSGAIDRAMDWRAAQNVMGDAGLMERFSEVQQEAIRDRSTTAANDTRDHVRKAYNLVVMLSGSNEFDTFELSYVPPSKRILEQAEEELLVKGRLHREFNPELFNTRWAVLWPKTATVITTQSLWEKFTRQGEAPILTSVRVLQNTIRQGVEFGYFGYGILHSNDRDKLRAASYERMSVGPFDARDLGNVEISDRTVMMRPSQIDSLFPPISKEEVAMLLKAPRQSVDSIFWNARKTLTVQGRVDQQSFFVAICEGVEAGLFGYADGGVATILRGSGVGLQADLVRFSGLLIGEEVPVPITIDEIANLLPDTGRLSVDELFEQSLQVYGETRVAEQQFITAVQRAVAEGQFGYAATEDAGIQIGQQEISWDGFVGYPEPLPPDTRIIRFKGGITAIELASVIKTVSSLSRLGQSEIALDLRLELRGEVNEHSVTTALNELRNRVEGLNIDDLKS